MKKDVGEVEPTTREEIKAALFKTSDRICPEKTRTLYSSLLRRTAVITRSPGYPTKYYCDTDYVS